MNLLKIKRTLQGVSAIGEVPQMYHRQVLEKGIHQLDRQSRDLDSRIMICLIL